MPNNSGRPAQGPKRAGEDCAAAKTDIRSGVALLESGGRAGEGRVALRGRSLAAVARRIGRNASRLVGVAVLVATLSASVPLGAQRPISEFAQNVTLHVLLHELGHAVFREFGVPIVANEENMADSFATTEITQFMRDDAVAVVSDRARSWLIEDAEVDPSDYDFRGEHELDIRRAYQAICLLYGADPAEWREAVAWVGFSEDEQADCSDTAPDQTEGWSRVLEPHKLPSGKMSNSVSVVYDEGPMRDRIIVTGLMERVADVARTFDWPEPIVFRFGHCDSGASWSRDDRTVLLCDDYVARFMTQGEQIANGE